MVWSLKWGDKKTALGPDVIRAVGGPVDLGDDDEDDDAPLTADSMVPFAWLSFPKEFFANVIDGLNGGGIVDFTPGDGNMAMAAVEANKAYFGYCHTESVVFCSTTDCASWCAEPWPRRGTRCTPRLTCRQ